MRYLIILMLMIGINADVYAKPKLKSENKIKVNNVKKVKSIEKKAKKLVYKFERNWDKDILFLHPELNGKNSVKISYLGYLKSRISYHYKLGDETKAKEAVQIYINNWNVYMK